MRNQGNPLKFKIALREQFGDLTFSYTPNIVISRTPTAIDAADETAGAAVDVVIADPSRQGLGAAAAGQLALVGAPVLILVSCDPVALARDAVLLGAAGYAHRRTVVADLFPHTHHVEAVTRFERCR